MSRGPEVINVGGRALSMVRIPPDTDQDSLATHLNDAGLHSPVPVVVLVGGTGGLDNSDAAVCAHLFATALIPTLQRTGAYLVDGGTNSGIIALAGQARRKAASTFPHVGVVAEGTVQWPRQLADPDREALEPNHTHIVVVPGKKWGDEALWLSAVAAALSGSGSAPSVTILANGGAIAYNDVDHSLVAGRPVLVLAATGRAASDIAAARQEPASDSDVAAIAGSPMVTVVPDDDPAAFTEALTAALRR